MEILITVAVISYIIYLRYYADLRTPSDKELDRLQVGVKLYNSNQIESAFAYFDQVIRQHPQWSMAYLYRARCHLKLGDTDAALADLRTAGSYDNTVADIHTETGRILYDRHDYDAAFTEFDKAIFHAQGRDAMPYYWRGRTRQKLGQSQEAEQDLEQATALEEQSRTTSGKTDNQPTSFFDKRLLTNAAFVLLHSVVLLYVVKQSPVIHWPYLMAAVSAAAIGFAEPRKGWSLAILQAAALWIGYQFTDAPDNGGERELEAFCLYGSMILTFIGSFIGSVLKRAMAK
ncbi:tetratricopeptide repeat protein [Spirosoma montaniterrae]|uniref:Uncharacterized protein n=1 Tax=Spirosoma montaniterrae TaxID=1178516 RepID=A0A1P9X0E1_9BACT|nr:tetratricopeptide repeat protein [Spirosoma montaniterrae]AQG81111.1 hypothetical protein AWR27_18360 [Spirosoma montaniterrae]